MKSTRKKGETCSFCCLCSQKVEIYAFGSCFHPVCFRCSAESRLLYDDKECPLCEMSLHKIFFTTTLVPKHKLDTSSFIQSPEYDGICFESLDVIDRLRALLEYKCAMPTCGETFQEFDDLKSHLRQAHSRYFCDVCLKANKAFTSDRQTYSKEVEKDYLENGNLQSELWKHYVTEHFVCGDRKCVGLSSSVFATEVELHKHREECHTKIHNKLPTIETAHSKESLRNNLMQAGYGDGKHWNEKIEEDDDCLKGNGTVVNVSLKFGFIERDDCKDSYDENIFFNYQACGLSYHDDMRRDFRIGDRVFFYARLHQRGTSKWKATYVKRIISKSVTSGNNDLTAQVKRVSINRTEHGADTGVIHYNLYKTYGFIVPSGTSGGNSKNNVYFGLNTYIEGSRKKEVFDLTRELNINEKVYYVLEDPMLSSRRRPPGKQLRAIRVWKCKDEETPENLFQEKQDHTDASLKGDVAESNSNINNAKNGFSPAVKKLLGENVHGEKNITKSKKDDVPCCSKSVVEPSNNRRSFLDDISGMLGINEIDIFLNVLGTIFGEDRNSLFNFECELAGNRLSLRQIAMIHFAADQLPRIYSVLMNRNVIEADGLTPYHCCFELPNLHGFNGKFANSLLEQEMAVQSEDVLYVKNSKICVLLGNDAEGKLEEIFLHPNLSLL